MFKSLFVTILVLVSCSVKAPIKPPEPRKILEEASVLLTIEIDQIPVGAGSGTIVASNYKITDIDGPYYSIVVLTAKHVTDTLKEFPRSTLVVKDYRERRYTVDQIIDHTTTDASLVRFRSAEQHSAAMITTKPLIEYTPIMTSNYPGGVFLSTSEGILNYNISNRMKDCWTCTAPVFPGSSGGGIYYKDSLELLGLTIKGVANFYNGNTIIIHHVHIFIPISVISDWIMENAYV